MKLIVGLGNPGKKYERTRHNVGFLALERLAAGGGTAEWKPEKKFFGLVATGQVGTEKVLFLKPQTMMNLSGKSVAAAAHFYKLSPPEVVVFSDDLDLPFGTVRWRDRGASGGHNGLKSITQSLGSDNFPRLKFGISTPDREQMPAEAFVLQKFSPDEWKDLPEIIDTGLEKFFAHVPC